MLRSVQDGAAYAVQTTTSPYALIDLNKDGNLVLAHWPDAGRRLPIDKPHVWPCGTSRRNFNT